MDIKPRHFRLRLGKSPPFDLCTSSIVVSLADISFLTCALLIHIALLDCNFTTITRTSIRYSLGA